MEDFTYKGLEFPNEAIEVALKSTQVKTSIIPMVGEGRRRLPLLKGQGDNIAWRIV